jgi:phosphomannomutase
VAQDYARAFVCFLADQGGGKAGLRVCIGRDSRPSGAVFSKAITDVFCTAGIDVVELGLVTTPGAAIMTRHLGCQGGVVVTASHNPAEYNGIKLLLETGRAPWAKAAAKITDIYRSREFKQTLAVHKGHRTFNDSTDTIHVQGVLSILDRRLIAERKFTAVLDSVNGAGAGAGSKLLTALGCRVVQLNPEATGVFAHPPEPLAANVGELCQIVKAHTADIGFAQDPDGDRLAIVDESGRFLGEEYTLALAAKYIFSKEKGAAATNLSTSRMVEDLAGAAGCRVIRTAVGEANVVEAMLKNHCIIGGEGNGGVIEPRVGLVRDSLVGMGLILQLMAQTGKRAGTLADEIPAYFMAKEKFAADQALAQRIMVAAKKKFADARLDTTDGCRFDFDDGWLHLRASNTEPVMRVITEASSAELTRSYVREVLDIRNEIVG